MLGLPELDILVCQQLSTHDLSRCARVNKKWHSIVIPHLWRDLTGLERLNGQSQYFLRMVQEDYLAVQQSRAPQKEEHGVERPTEAPLSALSKYGHWIQLLPNLNKLQSVLHEFGSGQGKDPTDWRLPLHLLTRCSPDVQVGFFSYSFHVNLDRADMRQLLDFTLPRLRHLHIEVRASLAHTKVLELMALLDRCGATLCKLGLDFFICGRSGTDAIEEPTENDQKSWASLEELSLYQWYEYGRIDIKTFWPWLFKRCGQVESLELRKFRGSPEVLTQAMVTHMPNLDQCTLGTGQQSRRIPDVVIAKLLSGSCNGWKRVKLGAAAVFEEMATNALEKHYPTLEALELTGSCMLSDNEVVQVLCSCANLQYFTYLDVFGGLEAEAFIDLDPGSGLLKPWKCETTLKELRMRVTGTARPGWMDESDEDPFPDEGRAIHGLLFARLARLTNLETLWLGDGVFEGYLDMSLGSGLSKLSGLRSLKELSVRGLVTNVGVKEVQWMVENWPRLCVISGLDDYGHTKEVVEWLAKNHPKIMLNPRSLAQCARVCKRWHTLVVPHLWRDLTLLNTASKMCWRAFRLLVLEDYIEEEQRQKLQDEGYAMEQPTRPSSPLLALSKYGHWIQLLPDPKNLRRALIDAKAGRDKGLVAYKLLLHLSKRCSSNVQVQSYSVNIINLDLPPDNFRRQMIDFIMPRVRYLRIESPTRTPTNVSKLMDLLDQCGTVLRKLELDISIFGGSGVDDVKEEPTVNELGRWTSLKELILHDWKLGADTKIFWPWFFKRCGQVEKLELGKCSGSPEFLTQAMLTDMPKLNQCTLGVIDEFNPSIAWCDMILRRKVVSILSGSCNGWKEVTVGRGTIFRRVAMDSLEKHCSTIEMLDLNGCRGQSSDEVVHILRSYINLRSFSNLNDYSKLDAKVFIDLDPDTDALKPWKCEATLKELNIRIRGVPRTGGMGGGDNDEASVGQAREIQRGVYDRLARLTNLETLCLGRRAFEDDRDDPDYLDMTLESGLGKLSGLRSLKSLCFPDPKDLYRVLFGDGAGWDMGLAAYKLLLHLFKRCSPGVQIQSFWMNNDDLDLPQGSLQRQMIDFTLPRLRYLSIDTFIGIPSTSVPELMELLDQCGTVLRKLALNINILGAPGVDDWTLLKELILYDWSPKEDTKVFWPWFFKRCGQVEKLGLGECRGSPEFLAQVMLTDMPKLNQCTLGVTEMLEPIQECKVTALLSGSCDGWKKVTVGRGATFGRMAMASLEKHCSTIETLDLNGYSGQSSDEIVHVLRSYTNLRYFGNINDYSKLDAKVFIDLDPDTGALKPWKCEATLKGLRIRIAGIPRTDGMDESGSDEGASIGQACEIHSGVYDRLARLPNLESLWLGCRAFKDNGDDPDYLEMTLERGLHKLSGLKSLKSLCFRGIPGKIGIKEVQWMVKNWPKLRWINGLVGSGEDWGTVWWLRVNHPRIEVREM
ncbi:MAG: hypothetical protein J3Q66DRAFT_372740 [Benniella sp.]|nr:MAG: hypothetical protein J3Q66DRAFT_372740 [Benniella sp.]